MSRRVGHLQGFLCSVLQPTHLVHRQLRFSPCLPSPTWFEHEKAVPTRHQLPLFCDESTHCPGNNKRSSDSGHIQTTSALGAWEWQQQVHCGCTFLYCPCARGSKQVQEQILKCISWAWLRVTPTAPQHVCHHHRTREGNGSAVPPKMPWSSVTIQHYVWQFAIC